MIDESPPAFPKPDCPQSNAQSGMSLRDYFAAKALVGWLSGPCQGDVLDCYEHKDGFEEHQRLVAVMCYGYADAMIKVRGQ